MKKILLGLMGVLLLAACDRPDDVVIYQCDGYDVKMDIVENGETMTADINGDVVELAKIDAASGGKYSGILNDTTVVLMSNGEMWTLMLDDEAIIDCKVK